MPTPYQKVPPPRAFGHSSCCRCRAPLCCHRKKTEHREELGLLKKRQAKELDQYSVKLRKLKKLEKDYETATPFYAHYITLASDVQGVYPRGRSRRCRSIVRVG